MKLVGAASLLVSCLQCSFIFSNCFLLDRDITTNLFIFWDMAALASVHKNTNCRSRKISSGLEGSGILWDEKI